MKKLWEPVTIGTMTLKNRIVFAPTSMGRDSFLAWERVAAGGAGLVIYADLSVAPSMMGAPGLGDDQFLEQLRASVARCHQCGCKVSAQIFHPEYDPVMARRVFLQARKGEISAEQARAAVAQSSVEYCDLLKKEEISEIAAGFRRAALRAEQAGFDMIQIHGDRLLGSFTSPLFNHRTDEYASHVEFPRLVVQTVREAVRNMPLEYKLTIRSRGFGRGGISQEETQDFVSMLDKSGIDSYHVSLANHTDTANTIPSNSHSVFSKEGCFTELAHLVRSFTDKPVCAVGKLQNPEYIEELLESGIALAAMSRQLIADPKWPEKVQNGREQEIDYCLYCNQACLQNLKYGKPVGCVLHSGEKKVREEITNETKQ